jgi:hypothetical protein
MVFSVFAGIAIIFFVGTNTLSHRSAILALEMSQIQLAWNLTELREQSNRMLLQENQLDLIIAAEQTQIPIILQKIIDIECTGVKFINGVPPNPVDRNLNITGEGGIEVIALPNAVIVNASGLNDQYQSEQSSISTLFSMTMMTQMAVDVLSTEIIRSVNKQTPFPVNSSNIDVDGVCGTSVYSIANGTVAVDMCVLENNVTGAFAGISFDFSQVNAQLDQLLLDVVVTRNNSAALLADAIATEDTAIYTVNNASTVANNFDLLAGSGISITNSTVESNTIEIRNTGVFGLNGYNVSRNMDVVPGYGIEYVNQTQGNITFRNRFFSPNCESFSPGVSVVSAIPPTGTSWQPLIQAWTPEIKTPANCYVPVIFQPITVGLNGYGVFNMPKGIWTLSIEMTILTQDGVNLQLSLGFVSAFYTLPFSSISFQQVYTSITYLYTQYQYEITLSSLEIPEGTQFSLHYQSTSTPTQTLVFYTEFRMIRINEIKS